MRWTCRRSVFRGAPALSGHGGASGLRVPSRLLTIRQRARGHSRGCVLVRSRLSVAWTAGKERKRATTLNAFPSFFPRTGTLPILFFRHVARMFTAVRFHVDIGFEETIVWVSGARLWCRHAGVMSAACKRTPRAPGDNRGPGYSSSMGRSGKRHTPW